MRNHLGAISTPKLISGAPRAEPLVPFLPPLGRNPAPRGQPHVPFIPPPVVLPRSGSHGLQAVGLPLATRQVVGITPGQRPGPPGCAGGWWGLGVTAGLLTLTFGYVISLDPPWLHLDFTLTHPKHLLLFLAGLVIACLIVRRPEAGLLGLLAVLYTNASEIGVRVHHLPSTLQVFLPVLMLALVARHLTDPRHRLVSHALMGWLLLYGFILFASSVWAANTQLADERLAEYAKSLMIVGLCVNWLTSRQTLWRAAWVLVWVGAFLGTISVYQVLTSSYGFEFWGFGKIKLAQIVGYLRQPRITGPLSDPNFYAQALVVLVPVALYRFWDESSLRLKAVAAYALAVVILALVFTYSRGGALAAGLVLLVAAVHKRVKFRHLLLGVLVVMPLLLLIPEQFEGRLGTLRQLLPGREDSELHVDTSIQERSLLMRTASEMFVQHPLLGVGAGNYSEHYEEYAERVGSSISSYDDFGHRRFPHSLYLQIAAETGVVGLGVFAVIIGLTLAAFWSAVRRFSSARDLRSASVTVSLALGFVGYLVSSVILHGDYMRYFWILVALAIAAQHLAQQQD